MVFSSITFLFYFLPAVLLLYFSARSMRWRNAVLMVMSLLFYLWGAAEVFPFFLISIALNWTFGLLVERDRQNGREARRRFLLVCAVVMNLGMLGYYKYANFMVAQLDGVLGWLLPQVQPWPVPGILLPIGISFFTFQGLSYVIDVAHGRTRALRNPVDFAMYIAMFPQLIAGPIVRYHQIEPQVREREHRWDDFFIGLVRFAHGLAKKVLIADSISVITDQAFSAAGSLTVGEAWVGVLAFTIQVYFDFSGYSDMAIGLGRLFGFRLPENFHRPFAAVSVTDFWRRWHITLSEWFRDYVYIPLGGSRTTSFKVYRNLLIVFTLVGVWHGASWTFVMFGLIHGMCMVFDRVTGRRFTGDFRHPGWQRAATFLVLLVWMVLFRARDLGQAWMFYRAMFGFPMDIAAASLWGEIPMESVWALALGSLSLLLPPEFTFGTYLEKRASRGVGWARLAVAGVALTAAVALVISRNFTPFIYFQF